jgi:hypothetical protein
LAAVLACFFAGCSRGEGEPHTASPSSQSSTTPELKPRQVRDVPHIGTVIISYSPLLVIRDQSTQGRAFYLKGIQASECLSFLKANPEPTERDVRAACPGAIASAP